MRVSFGVTLGCHTPVNFTATHDQYLPSYTSKQPSFVIVPFHQSTEDYKLKIQEEEEESFVDKVSHIHLSFIFDT